MKECRCGYKLNVSWGSWLLSQHTMTHLNDVRYCKKGDWNGSNRKHPVRVRKI